MSRSPRRKKIKADQLRRKHSLRDLVPFLSEMIKRSAEVKKAMDAAALILDTVPAWRDSFSSDLHHIIATSGRYEAEVRSALERTLADNNLGDLIERKRLALLWLYFRPEPATR
ncbi:MAG TPA: hypothetical protein VLC46_20235 [Thermoanaerobaculia bacterium]|jgi:hypothetical protein|nr:hypothetical protein [Thermoanaerobaculia bacterium]